jgi:uncharacterized membrane protein
MEQHKDKLGTIKTVGSFLLLVHKGGASRYWEIDALRGVAIVMMVIYHFAYDLTLFGYYRTNVFIGPWRTFARTTATLFVLLAGISLVLSYTRRRQEVGGWDVYRRYLARGLKLLGWGMVITLITWLYMGRVVIIFGILHLIGATTILVYPFLSLRWTNLVVAVVVIPLGMVLNQLPVTYPWLLLLGLRPRSLYQLDYFPLLPWFGVALLGVFVAQFLYPGGKRRLGLSDSAASPGVKTLAWLGQRSLTIYLVHQPLLFVSLTLVDALGLSRLLS